MANLFGRNPGASNLIFALAIAATAPAALAQQSGASAADTYLQMVKPITDRKCSGCHVNGGHAGGLKLDSFETLMKGGADGPAVVLGEPAKSMITRAIHYDDSSMQMPPKEKLSDQDIATIDQWIKESSAPLPVADPPPSASVTPAISPAASAPTISRSVAELVAVSDTPPTPERTAAMDDFFETQVRPVLVGNCYSCHGSAAKGGLRLDSRDGMLQGGKDGAVVVPGHPESSMLTKAVHYTDPLLQMPPRKVLKPEQIAALDQWIKMGAPWPKGGEAAAITRVTDAQRNFWAYKVPVRPAVPQVSTKWAETDIDRFVYAKLLEEKLTVGADADKHTLLRRVTYDLTGLPPTPKEIADFNADKSPQAYEHVVDRLLASPAYGERWGRMWLDVVRYADTSGTDGDFPIPQVAKYRNYVIQSFNEDKPYDRFIKEQLAGDLLPANSEPEHWNAIIATGYLAGANPYDRAQIEDAVDNLGYAFLGTTVACARCHDHKFDPIPTSDYYAIAGILKSTHFPNAGDDSTRLQQEFYVRDPKQLETPEIKAYQQQMRPILNALYSVYKLPGTYDDLVPQLQRRRMNLEARAPQMPEDAYAVSDMPQPVSAQIQVHGDATNLGSEVPRGTLQVLGGGPLPANTKGSGRLELANWIASKDNPLTARVIMNRIWLGHFGRGIVATPNNFGTRGVAPSNQALLDYLATELVAKNWSIKAMQREIVLSHVYRLSTASNAANEDIDPDNQYLWRHSRQRLDAEEIRDSLLADAQMLDRTPAGPHPFPPASTWNFEQQNPFTPDLPKYDNNHRTVYMMVQRNVKNRYMTLFDGADGQTSLDQRSSSLTPLQALYFMNAEFPMTCATNLATKLDAEQVVDSERLDEAFKVIFGRLPERAEREESLKFLKQMTQKYVSSGMSEDKAHQEASSHLFLAMFSSNEFMFIE